MSEDLGSRFAREHSGSLAARRFSRRQVIERSTIGGAGGMAMVLANKAGSLAAQEFDPDFLGGMTEDERAALLEAVAGPGEGRAPDSGTEGQESGEGGELRFLLWEAPQALSPHNSSVYADHLAAALVIEPLMHFLADGTLIPNLVKEVPTVENGLLATDLTSVTYKLLEGVTWSDGEPFSAEDVQFTWEWNLDELNSSRSRWQAIRIDNVEIVDDLTVTIHFKETNPTWFEAHAGTLHGSIYPNHVLGVNGSTLLVDFLRKPIGTGPYKVESFTQYESVSFVVNEHYREPNKPWFSTVTMEQHESPEEGTRAFFEDGNYDFCWNPDGEPAATDILEAYPTLRSSEQPPSHDPERAMQVLDDAGWVESSGVRSKDSVALELTYVAVTGEPHTTTQEIVKANLEAVGFRVELLAIDRSIFYNQSPGNEQSWKGFRADIQLYEPVLDVPIPLGVLTSWYAGPDVGNIPQLENEWRGLNVTRYINPEYDALYEQALTEADPATLADLCIQMNDIVAGDLVTIPLGQIRRRNACVNTLNKANFEFGPFSHHTWNIANWNRIPE
jgi:ABC-type transport system substrate-binding protein